MQSKSWQTMIGAVAVMVVLVACTHTTTDFAPQSWEVSDTLTIKTLRPGVWLHISWHTFPSGTRFPGNGLLVLDEDELILVDTAWGVGPTRELLNWIDRELHQPVTAAVVTHFHADSAGGAAALVEAGIPILSHPYTAEILNSQGFDVPAIIPGLNQADAVSFRGIEIYYPGAGHSLDNVVVWLPGTQILFGSCAVRSPEYSGRGNVSDADEQHWPIAMTKVLRRYPDVEIVVPGHGRPGSMSLLQHTIDLFPER